MKSGFPTSSEYNTYNKRYVDLVPQDDILRFLKSSEELAPDFYDPFSAELWDYRYQEGKWSLKEVLQHIIDTERVFSYRLLRISRSDRTALPGFDQDVFAESLNLESRDPLDIIEEYKVVRKATLCQLKSLQKNDWEKIGTASGSPVAVRALAYLIAGHELHHRKIIKERYLH